jgi:copper chaperone CopZ
MFICAALISPLPSCSPDRTQDQLASCVAKSTKINPADAQATQEEAHDAIGEDIVECMKQAGYKHNLTDSLCIDDVDFNVHCYTRLRF